MRLKIGVQVTDNEGHMMRDDMELIGRPEWVRHLADSYVVSEFIMGAVDAALAEQDKRAMQDVARVIEAVNHG